MRHSSPRSSPTMARRLALSCGSSSWKGCAAATVTGRWRCVAQVDEELAIIAEVGYEEYFLVVWDILQECRRRGIEWITRGSAADSLVCYCLGISDVCPIRFDLYFRRFLNKERMALNKLPDIDIDFRPRPQGRRGGSDLREVRAGARGDGRRLLHVPGPERGGGRRQGARCFGVSNPASSPSISRGASAAAGSQ